MRINKDRCKVLLWKGMQEEPPAPIQAGKQLCWAGTEALRQSKFSFKIKSLTNWAELYRGPSRMLRAGALAWEGKNQGLFSLGKRQPQRD